MFDEKFFDARTLRDHLLVGTHARARIRLLQGPVANYYCTETYD